MKERVDLSEIQTPITDEAQTHWMREKGITELSPDDADFWELGRKIEAAIGRIEAENKKLVNALLAKL